VTRLLMGFAAVLLLGGCTKYQMLDATIPSCGYVRAKDMAYGELPRQKLDVYRPRGAAAGARVVVFFYGGTWQAGAKADYRFAAEGLTSQGFVAVVPDYRVYPEVTFPAFVEDGALAVRWVHDHIEQFGGDPDRIYLMGHSAGAHIAALLTLDAHYLAGAGVNRNVVRGTAALSGPYDFKIGKDSRLAFGKSSLDATIDPRTRPIHFVDGKAPPMLLLHGGRDDVVGSGNAVRLAARITAAGGEAQYIIYPKLGHAEVAMALSFPFRWLAPVLHDAAVFFREH
jgi:acetyl esterase/lipase